MRLVFNPMHLGGLGGQLYLTLDLCVPNGAGEAGGLELFEQGQGFFELAREALAVDAEGRKGAGMAVEAAAMARVPYFSSVLPHVVRMEPGLAEVRVPKWFMV